MHQPHGMSKQVTTQEQLEVSVSPVARKLCAVAKGAVPNQSWHSKSRQNPFRINGSKLGVLQKVTLSIYLIEPCFESMLCSRVGIGISKK